MPRGPLTLTLHDQPLALVRFTAGDPIPEWATRQPFFSVTRTAGELSVVCPEEEVPAGVTCDRGWCALELEGPFAFDEVGILAAVVGPLAGAAVPVFAIATFDTDHVLVKAARLPDAVAALRTAGHVVRR